jgi:hypothetical protein
MTVATGQSSSRSGVPSRSERLKLEGDFSVFVSVATPG